MLLFTAISVFNKLAILQKITQKKFPAVQIDFFMWIELKRKTIMFVCHFVDPDLGVEQEEPTG